MRFLPLVLLFLFVPLAFVRSFDPPVAELPVSEAPAPVPEAIDELAAILPRDAAFVLRTTDWDAIRERAAESSWVAFFADERIGGVLESFLGANPLDPGGGFPSFDEIQASVHGAGAFFLVPAARGGFNGGLLLQPRGTETALADTLEGLKRMLDGMATLTRETHAGVELLRVETPGQDEVVVAFATQELVGICFGQNGLAADELAHATIDRQRGVDTTGDFTTGRLGRTAPEREESPVFSVHVDVQRLAESANPGWRRAPETQMLLRTGIGDVVWIHAYADVGKGEEFELAVSMHVPDDTLLAALVDGFGPLPTGMTAMFPARSLGVGLASYDVRGAFDSVLAFLGENDPETLQGLQLGLQMGGAQLGVDLQKDLIEQITGRFASFSLRVPQGEVSAFLGQGDHTSSIAQGGAFFMELHDPEPFERVLEQVLMLSELDPEVEARVFEGMDVNTLAFEDVFSLHWAFTDDGLLISEYESALYAALRQSKGLLEGSAADSTRFRNGFSEVPGASAVSLVETQSSVQALLGMAHAFSGLMAGYGMAPGGALALPDPAMAGDYFEGTLLFSLENEADRLTLRFLAR